MEVDPPAPLPEPVPETTEPAPVEEDVHSYNHEDVVAPASAPLLLQLQQALSKFSKTFKKKLISSSTPVPSNAGKSHMRISQTRTRSVPVNFLLDQSETESTDEDDIVIVHRPRAIPYRKEDRERDEREANAQAVNNHTKKPIGRPKKKFHMTASEALAALHDSEVLDAHELLPISTDVGRPLPPVPGAQQRKRAHNADDEEDHSFNESDEEEGRRSASARRSARVPIPSKAPTPPPALKRKKEPKSPQHVRHREAPARVQTAPARFLDTVVPSPKKRAKLAAASKKTKPAPVAAKPATITSSGRTSRAPVGLLSPPPKSKKANPAYTVVEVVQSGPPKRGKQSKMTATTIDGAATAQSAAREIAPKPAPAAAAAGKKAGKAKTPKLKQPKAKPKPKAQKRKSYDMSSDGENEMSDLEDVPQSRRTRHAARGIDSENLLLSASSILTSLDLSELISAKVLMSLTDAERASLLPLLSPADYHAFVPEANHTDLQNAIAVALKPGGVLEPLQTWRTPKSAYSPLLGSHLPSSATSLSSAIATTASALQIPESNGEDVSAEVEDNAENVVAVPPAPLMMMAAAAPALPLLPEVAVHVVNAHAMAAVYAAMADAAMVPPTLFNPAVKSEPEVISAVASSTETGVRASLTESHIAEPTATPTLLSGSVDTAAAPLAPLAPVSTFTHSLDDDDDDDVVLTLPVVEPYIPVTVTPVASDSDTVTIGTAPVVAPPPLAEAEQPTVAPNSASLPDDAMSIEAAAPAEEPRPRLVLKLKRSLVEPALASVDSAARARKRETPKQPREAYLQSVADVHPAAVAAASAVPVASHAQLFKSLLTSTANPVLAAARDLQTALTAGALDPAMAAHRNSIRRKKPIDPWKQQNMDLDWAELVVGSVLMDLIQHGKKLVVQGSVIQQSVSEEEEDFVPKKTRAKKTDRERRPTRRKKSTAVEQDFVMAETTAEIVETTAETVEPTDSIEVPADSEQDDSDQLVVDAATIATSAQLATMLLADQAERDHADGIAEEAGIADEDDDMEIPATAPLQTVMTAAAMPLDDLIPTSDVMEDITIAVPVAMAPVESLAADLAFEEVPTTATTATADLAVDEMDLELQNVTHVAVATAPEFNMAAPRLTPVGFTPTPPPAVTTDFELRTISPAFAPLDSAFQTLNRGQTESSQEQMVELSQLPPELVSEQW
eukprot:TRINITY_DN2574_c0_g1_i1.p1 TRINITY_DN2574_c0_g1~~TRINITY_DN2574_c0_g1_i1.p1  ORF type:complete len:1257 (-),score=298.41 TRINITY_DN2574_c0_g1_i1:23-3583(-)